ncbi:9547_t:CDS:2, partial [Funneliformis caledonium]
SGWDNDDGDDVTEEIQNLKNKELKLEWKEERKTSRSSYYEKYGPTGSFTKAAVNTKKITFFKVRNQATIIQSDGIL